LYRCEVDSEAKAITLTELKGMRMAAIIGLRPPTTAIPIPRVLYARENPKLM
jgi:hypothetical protein